MRPTRMNRRLHALLLGIALLPGPGIAWGAEVPAAELDVDHLGSSDIDLVQASSAAGLSAGRTWIRASVAFAWMGIDYRPVDADIFGFAERVEESRIGAGLSVSRGIGERWTLLADGGGYDGFVSYRSAWVSRWYQQFFAGLPGLREPDPSGFNGSVGVRWEYLPVTGLVQVEAGLGRDRIAPGYEEVLDGFGALLDVAPLRDELNNGTVKVAFENVWLTRVRSRVTVRMFDQSERNARWTVTGELNASISQDWVVRLEVGHAHESFRPPGEGRFRGRWIGGAVEWEFAPGWHLIGQGRHYRDSGEIENTLSFSTSAPALRTYEAGLGLRWTRGSGTVFLGGGPYRTEYDPVGFNTSFFANLYRDRTFVAVQGSFRWEF